MSEKDRVLNLLDRYKLSAKKSFGQNFLIDEGVLNKIVSSLEVDKFSNVIEIGPGLGSLTNRLVDKANKIYAVDADKDMIMVLNDLYKNKDNIGIIQSDFLRFKPDEFCSKDNRLFVGNLPYNITSKLIEYILQQEFSRMAIMVQKEVAYKLDYTKNNKECSPLGAFLKYVGTYKIAVIAESKSFYPSPKVDSAFVILDKRQNYDYKLYSIYKVLFKDPNKIISNCLKQFDIYKNVLTKLVSEDNKYLSCRARQLDEVELYQLAKHIDSLL